MDIDIFDGSFNGGFDWTDFSGADLSSEYTDVDHTEVAQPPQSQSQAGSGGKSPGQFIKNTATATAAGHTIGGPVGAAVGAVGGALLSLFG